jgi:hypothetical protein
MITSHIFFSSKGWALKRRGVFFNGTKTAFKQKMAFCQPSQAIHYTNTPSSIWSFYVPNASTSREHHEKLYQKYICFYQNSFIFFFPEESRAAFH